MKTDSGHVRPGGGQAPRTKSSMARVHLLEFEDQPWFPAVIRNAMTDYLSFMAGFADKPLAGFAAKLAAAMRETGDDTLVDLGAGGGGPSTTLALRLRRDGAPLVHLVLTDLYPNVARLDLAGARAAAVGVAVTPVKEPVSATDVPETLRGFRLMCNAFHHLDPAAAVRCLGDAVAKRQGIAILESVDRSPSGVVQVFTGVLSMLVMTPFVRPFRWSRLFFTYLLPVVPICTMWDGLVSCLRVYSPDEMQRLIEQLPENGHRWDVGHLPVPGTPVRLTYLVGVPDGEELGVRS